MWLSTFKEIFMLSLFALVKAQNHCSPPSLENAELISTPAPKQQYNTNDVVYYKCKSGYHFKGSSATKHKTRCTENGNFSPAPLKCYDLCDNRCQNDAFCNQGRCSCDQNHIGVSCEMRICKLPSVLHGTVKQVNPLNVDGKPGWVREGASILFQCDKGFSIKKGTSFSRCRRALGWDYGTLPVCQPDICEHSDISHGTAKPYRDVYAVGQTVTFSCNQGYEILHGDHQLSCGIGGVWSGTWPSCLPKKCPSIHLHNGMIDPPNARLTTGEYPVGSKLSLNCISGFYYRGISSKIACVGPPTVEWSSEPGVCILLSEFNDECQTEGKIMKVDGNGDASCVFVKPTTKLSQTSTNAKSGQSLTITCQVEGFPKPRVQWQKNDDVFRVDGLRITRTDSAITFKRLVTSDSGKYDCIAFNAAGSSTSTANLKVAADENTNESISTGEESSTSTDDNNCQDQQNTCNLAKQMKLCEFPHYEKRVCCKTCRKLANEVIKKSR
ncbi:complement component receptor 1-like protein [Clytia hemisphaerica]|uniref:Uncharacterized protein n=1 Tax=Clytia hemisphaerica TaxID=252671 RepID=A0A7M5V0A8_9CNID